MRPLHNFVHVSRNEAEATTSGGLYLTSLDKSNLATVLAVGPGLRNPDGSLNPCTVKEGEVVVLPRNGGVEMPDKTLVIRESEILGVMF